MRLKQGFKAKVLLCVFLISLALTYHTVHCIKQQNENKIAVAANNTNNTQIVEGKNIKGEEKGKLPVLVPNSTSAVKATFDKNVTVEHSANNKKISKNVSKQVHKHTDETEFPDSINSPFYAFIMLGFLAVVYIAYSLYKFRDNRAARYKTKGNHSHQEVKAFPLVFETDSEEDDEETVIYEHKFVI